LGVCSASKLALSAFLASAAGMRTIQAFILQKSQVTDKGISQPLIHWKSLSDWHGTLIPLEHNQKACDTAVVVHSFQVLLKEQI
jgi:hypothetical protein